MRMKATTTSQYPALLAAFYVSLALAFLGQLGVLAIQGVVMFADVEVGGQQQLVGFGVSAGLEAFFGVTAFVLSRVRRHLIHRNSCNIYIPINNNNVPHHTVYSSSE
jgi:hypothetical protein